MNCQFQNKISNKDILILSEKLFKDGLNISEIAKIVSNDLNVSKREVYQLLIKK